MNKPTTFVSEEARRQALGNGASSRDGGFKPKLDLLKKRKKTMLVGHESFLKGLEEQGRHIKIEMSASGDMLTGRLKTSDKYTVSVILDGEQEATVIFKHAIARFKVMNPVAA